MADDYQKEVIRDVGFAALTLTSWHQKVQEAECLHGLSLTGAKLTTGNYWFYKFPESASVAAHLSAEEEFVMDDYLSDSVITHYSTQKPLLPPNNQNPFLTHISHGDTSLAHWVISPSPERLSAGETSESEGFYVGLAPRGHSPPNHPRSQTAEQLP